MSFTQSKLFRLAGLVFILTAFAPLVAAEVHMPTGEYRESVVDLEVKVLGGAVRIERSWQADDLNKGEFRWHANPAWDDLEFKMDVIDGVPKTILRAGAKFERGGNDIYIWERDYFIRAEKDADGETVGWRWYDREGNWITWNAAGKITAWGDRNGPTVQFTRDGEGRIHQLLDVNGAVILTYHYEGERISGFTDYSNRSVSWHWTGDQLTSVTDVRGNEWHYTYIGGLLTKVTDPEGHETKIAYSGNRVVRITDALEQETTWSYDWDRVQHRYTVVTYSPEGRRAERRYDRDGILMHEEIGDRLTYQLLRDGDFVEIAIDERGGTTRTELDANRNPVLIRYPDGSQESNTWDANNNLLSHTDERGIESRYTYDAKGRRVKQIEAFGLPEERTTTWTFDAHGNPLTQTVKGATAAEDATTTWTWDGHGNMASVTDAEGHTTSYPEYHVTGVATERKDPAGHTWLTVVDEAGNITAQTDPLHHTTGMSWDKMGRLETLTDALGHTTTHVYDGVGQEFNTIDPLGYITKKTWDKDGNLEAETDQAGHDTSYSYDLDGRLKTITDPAGNVISMEYGTAADGLAGLLTATVYPTYREEYKYDPRGRRTQTILVLPAEEAGGQPQRLVSASGFDAAGNLISETDPAGRASLHAYDALGRLTKTTDAAGGVTQYGYDTRDNLTSVTDANGHTHTFTYDKTNQVKTEARPSGATITYGYDTRGNLTERISPNGERREFDYDEASRKTEERHYPRNATAPSQIISYEYYDNGQLAGYTQTGDTASSASYTYDARGQKTEETVTYGEGPTSFSLTTETSYTTTGQKKTFTYPDGTEIEYDYTDAGFLASASLPGAAGSIEWQDYQWQQPTRITMPGALRTFEYDALQRPLRIKSQALGNGNHEAPTGAVIMDYRYTYDAAGNITQRQTEEGAWSYGYDQIDRLTAATPPEALQQDPAAPEEAGKLPVEVYSYDPVHNRLSSQHQPGAWEYNADNQLLAWGIGAERRTYTYNPNGHTETETTGDPVTKTRKFLYNAAERLTEIRDDGQTIGQYQYDPMGRRIKKETAEGTTWFLYADEGLIAELTPAGTATRYYGWQPDGLWGTDPLWIADHTGSQWQTHLYHNDHLWTPQRLTDTAGTVQWSARAEAFGNTAVTVQAIDNPLRFPGQYENDEDGLHYNWNRDYVPGLGRYVQSDPIQSDGGINRYVYVESDPIKWSDPYGLVRVGVINSVGNGRCTVVTSKRGYEPKIDCLTNAQIRCGAEECVEKHEQSHIKDFESHSWAWWVAMQGHGLVVVWVGPDARKYANDSELRAYKESSKCFLDKIALLKRNEPCSDCIQVLQTLVDFHDDIQIRFK